MTTATLSSGDVLLRNALRGNSAFSLASAVLVGLTGGALPAFLGVGISTLYFGLAALLLIHGLALFYYTRHERIPGWFAWYAIGADLAWVVASTLLIFTDLVQFTETGNWVVFLLADIVLVFAIVQYIGLRRARA